MVAITLPDGSVRKYDRAVTGAEVAADIGPGLAKAALAVKIDGVLHEFSPIPGVVEDATDIILNLKQIPLKLHVDHAKTLTVRIDKAGVHFPVELLDDVGGRRLGRPQAVAQARFESGHEFADCRNLRKGG